MDHRQPDRGRDARAAPNRSAQNETRTSSTGVPPPGDRWSSIIRPMVNQWPSEGRETVIRSAMELRLLPAADVPSLSRENPWAYQIPAADPIMFART